MAVNRQGMILTVVMLIMTGAATLTALGIATHAALRRAEIADHVARIQGREWCLGALSLRPGGSIDRGVWRISRAADSSCWARGPRGTYCILASGRERWVFTGGRR